MLRISDSDSQDITAKCINLKRALTLNGGGRFLVKWDSFGCKLIAKVQFLILLMKVRTQM